MLSKLSPQNRITEVNTAADNFLMAYKKQTWESDTYLVSIFTGLQTESSHLTTAINRSKAESNLDKKDVTRDEKIKALNYLLLGSIHHPDIVVKTAAENLTAIFAKYGLKMTHTSYATESSLIESMLEDLSAPELQADITAISGFGEVIADLQTANNDFKTANFTWEEKKAQEGLTRCASDIKKDVLYIINDEIVVYLNAMQQANKAIYGELAQTISQIINDTNEAVKKRGKKEEVMQEVSIDNQ